MGGIERLHKQKIYLECSGMQFCVCSVYGVCFLAAILTSVLLPFPHSSSYFQSKYRFNLEYVFTCS